MKTTTMTTTTTRRLLFSVDTGDNERRPPPLFPAGLLRRCRDELREGGPKAEQSWAVTCHCPAGGDGFFGRKLVCFKHWSGPTSAQDEERRTVRRSANDCTYGRHLSK